MSNHQWLRDEYERAKARNAMIPPHGRMVVTNPALSAHERPAPSRCARCNCGTSSVTHRLCCPLGREAENAIAPLLWEGDQA